MRLNNPLLLILILFCVILWRSGASGPKIFLRVICALLISQAASGVSAALANGITQFLTAGKYLDSPSSTFELIIMFSTIGGVMLIPATLIVEVFIVMIQSYLRKPSLALQVVISIFLGCLLSWLLVVFDKQRPGSPVPTGNWVFAFSIGTIGGVLIALAWFFIVTRPTHHFTLAKAARESVKS